MCCRVVESMRVCEGKTLRKVIKRILLQGQLLQGAAGPLALMNGATARDVLLIAVPAGIQFEAPVHVIHIASGEQHTSRCCLSGQAWARHKVSWRRPLADRRVR